MLLKPKINLLNVKISYNLAVTIMANWPSKPKTKAVQEEREQI